MCFGGDRSNPETQAVAPGDRVGVVLADRSAATFIQRYGSLSAQRRIDRQARIRLAISLARLSIDRSTSQCDGKALCFSTLPSPRCGLAGILLLRLPLGRHETLFGIGRTETATRDAMESSLSLMRWLSRLRDAGLRVG